MADAIVDAITLDFQAESPGDRLVEQKMAEYARNERLCRFGYYVTRTAAVGATACIPFVVGDHGLTVVCAAVAAAAQVVDTVFDLRARCRTYGAANAMLVVEELRRRGELSKLRKSITVIIETETALLARLVSIRKELPPKTA